MRCLASAVLLFASFTLVAAEIRELVPDFSICDPHHPYIGPDNLVVRSIEDNVTGKRWPIEKQLAFARYPLATALSQDEIPKTGVDAYALLKRLDKPIMIGHCWIKNTTPGLKDELRRIILWLEPRPKYLNDDELKEAVTRGDFNALFPTFPIGKFALVEGRRPSSRYVNFPIPTVATSLSPHGVPPDGPKGEVRPITINVELYSVWSFPGEELIAQQLDTQMENLGSGRMSWREVVHTPSGLVLKSLGSQSGHMAYRWVSGGNLFGLNILGEAPGVLDAFLKQNPSELPKDFSLDLQAAGMVILRRGLARLRAAPPVLEDDDRMIRIRPLQNRNQFGRGIDLLKALKDLWPVVYGYEQARRERYNQHLSPESTVFSWQSYIDEETAARAEVIAAVTAFAEQAERRGLLRQEKVPRRPWQEWAADALPPCYVLGPEK